MIATPWHLRSCSQVEGWAKRKDSTDDLIQFGYGAISKYGGHASFADRLGAGQASAGNGGPTSDVGSKGTFSNEMAMFSEISNVIGKGLHRCHVFSERIFWSIYSY